VEILLIPFKSQLRSREAPNSHPQDDRLSIIGSASKQMLLASKNSAYFELFEENMRLKVELEAKKYF
jgi:hypothetical protein